MKKTTIKKAKLKTGVLDESNIHSVLTQMKKPFKYEASIKIFGRYYTSTGSTLKECLENLKVGKAGGVCAMTVTHGDKKREKIMNGGMLNRLFSQSRLMHEIALKNVMAMFGDI